MSTALLVMGALLIAAGLGWAGWMRSHRPAPPVETEAGAVVLAVTAPATPSPEPTPLPTATPPATPTQPLPTPRVGETISPTPTAMPPTPAPHSTPTSTPVPQPPDRIVAPAIKLDAPVVPMGWKTIPHSGGVEWISDWVVPGDAAGWHENSALAGQSGNTVISGHHNIEGKVFRYVVDLEMGNEIILYAGDKAYPYIVTEKYILKEAGMPLRVRQKNAQWIASTDDIRLTLVTCWPYEWPGNTHRVIVVAKPLFDTGRSKISH